MSVLSAFSSSVMAMMSQAHALNTIGNNIANMTTGGFKRSETNFSTLISKTRFQQSDQGGIKPKDFNRIDRQGILVNGTSDLDVAINGAGFFILNTTLDGSGETLYTRDGTFDMRTGATTTVAGIPLSDGTATTLSIQEGYLIDKNGYFVQGWTSDPVTGAFSTTGTVSALRIDQFAFTNAGIATTAATLGLNLPAADTIGNVYVRNIDIFDSSGVQHSVPLHFTKNPTLGEWGISITSAVAQIDTVTLVGTVDANDTYSVTVDGTTVTYPVTGGEANPAAIRDALVTALNADTIVGAKITAAAGVAAGEITLTSRTPGTGFVSTAASANLGANADNFASSTTTINNVVGPATATITPTAAFSYTASSTTAEVIFGVATGTIRIQVPGGTNPVTGAFTPLAVGDSFTVSGTTGKDGTYTVAGISADGSTITVDSATPLPGVDETDTNGSTYIGTVTQPLVFNGNGQLTSPATGYTMALTWSAVAPATAGTATFTLDVSDFTQFQGQFLSFSYSKNGNSASDIKSLKFNNLGELVANFTDSTFRSIYKLPLAVFSNANKLERRNGNTFAVTSESGSERVVAAGSNGFAMFIPGVVEKSNVDVADEFTRMIKTQNAYNSAATVFKTIDEMTMTARDLKR